MRTLACAIGAALGALAMAPAANASLAITCPDKIGSGHCTFDEAASVGTFGNTLTSAQSFSDSYALILTQDYRLAITAADVGNPIIYSIAGLFDALDNPLGSFTFDSLETSYALTAGTYSIRVAGDATGGAVYSGNIRVTPVSVPAPASWSLMLVGAASLGVTLRKRMARARLAVA